MRLDVRIDRHMFVDVLAVVDGGVLDFADRFFDLVNGGVLIVVEAFAEGVEPGRCTPAPDAVRECVRSSCGCF